MKKEDWEELFWELLLSLLFFFGIFTLYMIGEALC